MSENDLQVDEQDDDSPSPDNSSGTSSDWEKRFKGLQRKFNTQEKQLSAKDSVIAKLQGQVQTLQQDSSSTANDYESQLAELRGQVKTLSTERDMLITDKEALAAEVGTLKVDRSNREFLTGNDEYSALVPWYDKGLLAFDASDEEAAKAKLDTFKAMLGDKAVTDVKNKKKGSTPDGTVPDPNNRNSKMTESELSEWLIRNPGHADYSDYEELYLSAVESRLNDNT